jgi:hypothetical protein
MSYPLHQVGTNLIRMHAQFLQQAICVWRDMDRSTCLCSEATLLVDLEYNQQGSPLSSLLFHT